MVLFWIGGALLLFTASAAVLCLGLHLSTGEPVPLARARVLVRWSVVVVLATFNGWIFDRVVDGVLALR